MKQLSEIWDSMRKAGCESDKGSVHSYIPIYEKLLKEYRYTAKNVLEIGLFNGYSLMMWKSYFPLSTKVYGIDCSETPHDGMADLRPLIKAGWPIHIFDAEDVTEVSKRFFGIKFDVIIEDAGHEINQQLNLYRIWKEYLADDGIYIIEDIQDIRNDRHRFYEEIGYVDIIDLRKEKGRYDDVLIVIK